MSDGIERSNVSAAPQSSAAQWAPLARLIQREQRIAAGAAQRGPIALFAYELSGSASSRAGRAYSAA